MAIGVGWRRNVFKNVWWSSTSSRFSEKMRWMAEQKGMRFSKQLVMKALVEGALIFKVVRRGGRSCCHIPLNLKGFRFPQFDGLSAIVRWGFAVPRSAWLADSPFCMQSFFLPHSPLSLVQSLVEALSFAWTLSETSWFDVKWTRVMS